METSVISKKLIHGFVTLTFRRAVLLAINYATINLLLARILPVEVTGIFNLANTILSFFAFFSDVGLAAALIQKKEISEEDIRTTFTIQEILSVLVSVTVIIFAPMLASIYSLDETGMWLIRALGFGFFLSSLKVIPSVLLERELKFAPLVWVEVIETLVFNLCLIFLVWQGMRVEAFSIATLLRGVVGTIAIYLVAPWKVRIGISKISAKKLLNFGVLFQVNSILALVKDRLSALVVANIIGVTGVGYLTWAQNLAFLPLEVMNIIIRVSFPSFSRLQDNEKELSKAVEKSLFLTALFLYPMLFGILAVAPNLVKFLVSNKWLPSLPLIYLFAINTFWASLSTTFTNVFNAVGKISISLKLMVMWTVLTWVLSPVLAYYFGFIGVAMASAVIAFSSIIPIILARKYIQISIWPSISKPLIASVLMAIICFGFGLIVTNSLLFFVQVTVGVLSYAAIMFLIARRKILEEFRV